MVITLVMDIYQQLPKCTGSKNLYNEHGARIDGVYEKFIQIYASIAPSLTGLDSMKIVCCASNIAIIQKELL